MRKGTSFFTSKTIIVLGTTVLQIAFWVGLFFSMELVFTRLGMERATIYLMAFWIYMGLEGLGIILGLYILMRDEHPSYKLVWMLVLIVSPILGLTLYFLFGRHKLRKRLKKNELSSQMDLRNIWESTSIETALTSSKNKDKPNVCRLIAASGLFPVFGNTHTKYYDNMTDIWSTLLIDLSSAEKFIYIESFIIREGEFWDSIKKILVEKSLSGVDVRLTYDDVGTDFTKKEIKALTKVGIKVYIFNKLGITFDASKNNRSHRKMIIIDGDIAFTGGFNLSDEYVGKIERFGKWRDAGIRLEGEAVSSFTLMFLHFWQMQKGVKTLDRSFGYLASEASYHPESRGFVQPIASGPLKNDRLHEFAFLQIISEAKNTVYIQTPYLILDNELEVALCIAAKSGVDVRIIMPGIPDKKIVFGVSRSFYPNLLKAGVKIYEYAPGFVHTKALIVDGKTAYAGTCNFDYRSLFLHFECGVILYDTDSVLEMQNSFMSMLESCRAISLEWAVTLQWHQRLWRSIARLFAPLL